MEVSQDKTKVTVSMMNNSIIARFTLEGDLDHSFQNNGLYQFPHTLSVIQISGMCQLSDGSLLVADCGKKMEGRNKIFLIHPPCNGPQGACNEVNIFDSIHFQVQLHFTMNYVESIFMVSIGRQSIIYPV